MTWNQAWQIVTDVLAPTLIASLEIFLAGLIAILIARKVKGIRYQDAEAFLLAFSVLGVTIGFATAHSRTPAIGAVLPALLTLIAGALTYSVSKEGLSQYRPVLPHCITLLAIASLVGLSIGATNRARFDKYERDHAAYLLRHERVTLEYEKAKHLADLEVYKAERLAQIKSEYETAAEKR